VDDVLRFRGLLEQYEKTYHIRLYRDAPHGWLNDTMPGRYRKEAAQDAWRLLLEFLGKTLKGQLDGDRVYSTFESDVSTNYDYKKNVRLE
jgi:carboxymethylenebutenolidase